MPLSPPFWVRVRGTASAEGLLDTLCLAGMERCNGLLILFPLLPILTSLSYQDRLDGRQGSQLSRPLGHHRERSPPLAQSTLSECGLERLRHFLSPRAGWGVPPPEEDAAGSGKPGGRQETCRDPDLQAEAGRKVEAAAWFRSRSSWRAAESAPEGFRALSWEEPEGGE